MSVEIEVSLLKSLVYIFSFLSYSSSKGLRFIFVQSLYITVPQNIVPHKNKTSDLLTFWHRSFTFKF